MLQSPKYENILDFQRLPMLVKNMTFKGLTEVIREMLIEKKVLKAPLSVTTIVDLSVKVFSHR